MGESLMIGEPGIEVHLRRSNRARRYSLRISAADGAAYLTIPHRGSTKEATKFAADHENWLRSRLAALPDLIIPGLGTELPFEGRCLLVAKGDARSVRLEGGRLFVPGPSERVPVRIKAFLVEAARNRLAHASDHYAGQLGRRHAGITLRDTKSRWGSCSSEGRLMYSWRLIMAPPEVLSYVAAHEVAHLAEMNHSAAFWKQVDKLFPDHKSQRQWLRDEGRSLHRFKF